MTDIATLIEEKPKPKLTFKNAVQELWFNLRRILALMGYPKFSEIQGEVLRCDKRIILVSGGERAGKSVVAATYLLSRMMNKLFRSEKKKLLYWLVAADYAQSRVEFEYILAGLRNVGAVESKNVSMPEKGPWSLKAFNNRVRVVTKSAVDVRKLGGVAPNGILINEAAQVDYSIYNKCVGRLAEKRGFLFLSGTLESSTDWYAESLKRWQAPNAEDAASFVMPSWANPIVFPKGESDPEIVRQKKLLPRDEFLRRFGAVATPPENLVLPEFNYKTHVPGDVEFIEWEDEQRGGRYPVQLWIDPGFSGSNYAVEVVQIVDADHHCDLTHVHVIDEVYTHNAHTAWIIEECREREWWDNVNLVVIDVAGAQHHAAPSHAEMWAAEGIGVVWSKIPVEDGILRHRTFLKDPAAEQARIFFSEDCAGATKEYGRWKRKKPKALGDQASRPATRNCDALKAVNYGLVNRFGFVEYEGEPTRVTDPFS